MRVHIGLPAHNFLYVDENSLVILERKRLPTFQYVNRPAEIPVLGQYMPHFCLHLFCCLGLESFAFDC